MPGGRACNVMACTPAPFCAISWQDSSRPFKMGALHDHGGRAMQRSIRQKPGVALLLSCVGESSSGCATSKWSRFLGAADAEDAKGHESSIVFERLR